MYFVSYIIIVFYFPLKRSPGLNLGKVKKASMIGFDLKNIYAIVKTSTLHGACYYCHLFTWK